MAWLSGSGGEFGTYSESHSLNASVLGFGYVMSEELALPPMQVTIELPDDFSTQVQPLLGNLSRKVLEMLVVEAYEKELITRYQVGIFLGLPSRFDVDHFLKSVDVYQQYDETDLEADRQTLQQLRAEGK